MDEVMKCPYCGSEAVIKGRKKIRVVCTKCGVQGATKALKTDAVNAWECMVKAKEAKI